MSSTEQNIAIARLLGWKELDTPFSPPPNKVFVVPEKGIGRYKGGTYLYPKELKFDKSLEWVMWAYYNYIDNLYNVCLWSDNSGHYVQIKNQEGFELFRTSHFSNRFDALHSALISLTETLKA